MMAAVRKKDEEQITNFKCTIGVLMTALVLNFD
ncbi:unknown [Prevotella sp. CAG:487]|nr:unknown [Prevotella sp. CAG:487]